MLYLWDHEILPHNALCVPDDFTYCIQASWFIGVPPFRAFEEHGLSNFQFVQVLRHFAFWIDFDDKVDMSRSVIVRSGGVWPKEIFAIRFFCFEGDVLADGQAEQGVFRWQTKSARHATSRDCIAPLFQGSQDAVLGSQNVPEQSGIIAEHLLVYQR